VAFSLHLSDILERLVSSWSRAGCRSITVSAEPGVEAASVVVANSGPADHKLVAQQHMLEA